MEGLIPILSFRGGGDPEHHMIFLDIASLTFGAWTEWRN
jgi:hypothetical protein